MSDDTDESGPGIVEDVVSTVSMLVLFILMVPVGLLVLVVSFLTLGLITSTVGLPSGALGSMIGIGWLIGTLAVLVLVFRKLYRRMPRRLRAAYAAPMQPRASRHLAASEPTAPRGGRPTPSPTLAELDARLAPKVAAPEDPPG